MQAVTRKTFMSSVAVMALLAMTASDVLAESGADDFRRRTRTNQNQQVQPAPNQDSGGGIGAFFNDLFASKPKQKKQPQQTPTRTKAAPTQPATYKPVERKPAPDPQVTADKKWWKKTGNRVVYNFRDCAKNYALKKVAEGQMLPETDLITQAIVGPCRKEYEEMAITITGHMGGRDFRRTSRELMDTTFIPEIQKAIAEAHSGAEKDLVKVQDGDTPLASTKAAMFACLTNRADSLARRSKASDAEIAQSVLATCRDETNRYFSLLFEQIDASEADREKQKRTAIDQTYRAALEKRVALVRAQQLASDTAEKTVQ